MSKAVVRTADAPAPVGPYSQAISSGGFVFCSGSIPLDPATGKLVGGDIAMQTRRALDSLAAVLEAAGSSPSEAVRCTVYLADLGDFAAMNAVYAEVFGPTPPARVTIQAAALPLGARVEIECIARLRDAG